MYRWKSYTVVGEHEKQKALVLHLLRQRFSQRNSLHQPSLHVGVSQVRRSERIEQNASFPLFLRSAAWRVVVAFLYRSLLVQWHQPSYLMLELGNQVIAGIGL